MVACHGLLSLSNPMLRANVGTLLFLQSNRRMATGASPQSDPAATCFAFNVLRSACCLQRVAIQQSLEPLGWHTPLRELLGMHGFHDCDDSTGYLGYVIWSSNSVVPDSNVSFRFVMVS